MNLKQFLHDRITEEEVLAQAVVDSHAAVERWNYSELGIDGAHITRWSPWRVIAGCVSRRLILAAHTRTRVDQLPGRSGEVYRCSVCLPAEAGPSWPCYTLRAMGLEYADHPEYRIAWRPPAHGTS